MSVTSGVVSRIEVTSYVHGAAELLGIQIDAAVRRGGGGGEGEGGEGPGLEGEERRGKVTRVREGRGWTGLA